MFKIAKGVLEKLNLSKGSVSYFASLVDHYSLQGLSRIDQTQVLLWLICFVFERHKKITDNLATMLIYLTSNFEDVVKTLKEEMFEQSLLDDSPWRKSLIKLLKCYVGEKINKEISFYKHVQNVHKFFNQDQIKKVILSFEKKRSKEKEKFKWIAVDKISSSYKNRIQLIIQCLDFYGEQGVGLQELHEFLKDFLQKRRIIETINYEDIPKNHIFKKDKKSTKIYKMKRINPSNLRPTKQEKKLGLFLIQLIGVKIKTSTLNRSNPLALVIF